MITNDANQPTNEDPRQQIVALLPRLRRFACALTGSLDEADDIVQSACERALGRLEQWQPGTRLDSWMYRIIQNLWIDRGRARRVRGEETGVETLENMPSPTAGNQAEGRMLLRRTQEAIAKLPEEQRVVLAMVSVDGFSYQEAADALDLPIGTVMSRLARARRRLHETVYGEAR